MNFLQGVARLQQECGVSGTAIVTTIANQTDELQRLVNWYNSAWMDIQNTHEDWQWMRTHASCVTVAGQATYAPATDFSLTDFGAWERNSFRNYATVTGTNSEIEMDYIDYESWRASYQLGALRTTQTRPMEMTITPEKYIGVGPVPAAGYTLTGDYYRVATEMALDTDIPALPAQFHLMIVYRAMMSYGAFEAATEVYDRGQTEFNKMMNRLNRSRMTEVTAGSALA